MYNVKQLYNVNIVIIFFQSGEMAEWTKASDC